ncbi:MAG TPA: hypothetical protein PLM75_02400 [bacterium]|nr:hypothetical protein [bacterium]
MSEFIIKCPCCETTLIIDKATGRILKSETVSQQKSKKSFDELFQEQAARKDKISNQFEMLFNQEQNKSELLEKELEKLKKKLEEDTKF